MATATANATIETKTKDQAPPDAISCILVDHSNSRLLYGILDNLIKKRDDAMLEKLVHTIAVHCRLHNQTRFEVLLPLVQQLQQGEKLAPLMKEKMLENEKLLAALDSSKKHLDNKEFVEVVQQQKQADLELMDMAEAQILPAMLEELDVQALTQAAEKMEEVKSKAPLEPQAEMFAAA
ncbi:hypothetical protein D9Q98_000497 [Chlorella vulgaris]|uniref:Uncharacterized protein n=1 Tax=Chlorella vulgaris TaxID=3077 RepID=A0A9D4Z1L9_CHLVU|nr:hypothetical protein D9Q98_000497 [Chlorella vulgaris]